MRCNSLVNNLELNICMADFSQKIYINVSVFLTHDLKLFRVWIWFDDFDSYKANDECKLLSEAFCTGDEMLMFELKLQIKTECSML